MNPVRALPALLLASWAFCQTQPTPPPTSGGQTTPQPIPAQNFPATTSGHEHRSAFDCGAMAGLAPPPARAVGGRVLVAGQPPANPVPVAVECIGTGKIPRFSVIAVTDNRGRYSQAIDSIAPLTPGETGFARFRGCLVSLRLPGFQPFAADLEKLAGNGSASSNTIELRKISDRGQGTTISATGYQAPKRAWNEYARSLESLSAMKPAEARKHLESAVAEYPGYAAAWFALGEIFGGGGDREASRKAYIAAARADAAYIMPRIRLGWMAAEDRDWPAAAQLAGEVLELAPEQFPDIYFLRATAEFNLGDLGKAEQFATAGLSAKGDPEPQLERLLGAIVKRTGQLSR